MYKPLVLHILDIDDKDIMQRIKSSLNQFKDKKDFTVLVFPVVSKSMEINNFIPLTSLPFFVCELNIYLNDESLIQKAIDSTRITLENTYEEKRRVFKKVKLANLIKI